MKELLTEVKKYQKAHSKTEQSMKGFLLNSSKKNTAKTDTNTVSPAEAEEKERVEKAARAEVEERKRMERAFRKLGQSKHALYQDVEDRMGTFSINLILLCYSLLCRQDFGFTFAW